MLSKRRRTLIFIEAAILTIAIYLFSIVANGYLDELRVNTLNEKILEKSLEEDSYLIGSYFYNSFDVNSCDFRKNKIFSSFEELKELGTDLTNYGSLFLDSNEGLSKLKQRKYFQDQLELYEQVLDYNFDCENELFPIVYFYNGLSTSLDKQSIILDQFSLNNKNKTVIFSFDYFFENEPNLEILKKTYLVSNPPFIIFNQNKTSNSLKGSDGLVSLNSIAIEYKKFRGEI